MQITFASPNPARGYTEGTASIAVSYPGGGSFNRNNIPVSMLSMPTGAVDHPP
jgi:hypothetical protein